MTFFPLISFRLPIVFHFTVPWKPGNLYVFGHLMYRKYICLTNLFPPQRAVFVFSACCFHFFYIFFFRFLSLTVLMETGYGRGEKDYCWYSAATCIILSYNCLQDAPGTEVLIPNFVHGHSPATLSATRAAFLAHPPAGMERAAFLSIQQKSQIPHTRLLPRRSAIGTFSQTANF